MTAPAYLTAPQLAELDALDLWDDWQERAAIMEHDGKMPRQRAEQLAYWRVTHLYRKQRGSDDRDRVQV